MNKGPRSLRALSMNFSKKGPGDYSSPLSVSRAPKIKVQALAYFIPPPDHYFSLIPLMKKPRAPKSAIISLIKGIRGLFNVHNEKNSESRCKEYCGLVLSSFYASISHQNRFQSQITAFYSDK